MARPVWPPCPIGAFVCGLVMTRSAFLATSRDGLDRLPRSLLDFRTRYGHHRAEVLPNDTYYGVHLLAISDIVWNVQHVPVVLCPSLLKARSCSTPSRAQKESSHHFPTAARAANRRLKPPTVSRAVWLFQREAWHFPFTSTSNLLSYLGRHQARTAVPIVFGGSASASVVHSSSNVQQYF